MQCFFMPMSQLVVWTLAGLLCRTPAKGSSISGQLTRVWGPGLNPSLVLPVRYFFIHGVDSTGSRLNASAGDNAFKIAVEGVRKRCPAFTQLLDRKDGSYIVRYRLYETCEGLRISVALPDGSHVAASPYVFSERIFHSSCDCPVSLGAWKKDAGCPETLPQMDRDLGNFMHNAQHNISRHFSDLSGWFHPQSASFCHYVVRSQKVYRKCFGEHVGFTMFMDSILLFLLRRATFLDVEFIVNLGDYPIVLKNNRRIPKLPIFSWCGSTEAFDVVMPTYDVTESSLTAMDRVALDMLSVQATKTPVWKEKKSKAFWRGRDARQERLKLVQLSRNHSDLIDAGLTHFFFFRDEEHIYGPTVSSVDFFQFFQHKYQINLDGTVAAYRFPYLLAGDGVVFKQDSEYYEHFYHDLKPWTHYIPVKRNLDDIVEKLRWAQTHDAEALLISKAGSDYARENLLPHNIFCYYTVLLEKWAPMVMQSAVLTDGFEHVPQDVVKSKCDCDTKAQRPIKSEL